MMEKEKETDPLLSPNNAIQTPSDDEVGFNFWFLAMFPVLGLYFYATGIDLFGSTEYIHTVVKQDYFPNIATNVSFSACDRNISSHDHQLHDKVQQKSAEWIMYFHLSTYLPATVSSLVLGPLTDRYGRKFLLSLVILGYACRLAALTIVARYRLSLGYVVGGSLVFGLCGGLYAMFSLTFSIISDVTQNKRKRTLFIVAVELFISSTISISAFVTGYYIKAHGYFQPFLLATCFAAVSFLFAMFVLPETLRSRDTSQDVSVITSAKRCVQFYTGMMSSNVRRQYVCLILAFVFYSFSALHRSSIDTLYELGRPFCWSPTKVGWFGTLRTGGSNLGSMLLLIPLRRCFADDVISVVATFIAAASLVVEGLARNDIMLYIVAALGFPGKITIPVIRSLMSQLTAPEKQGALFASIGLVENVCALFVTMTINLVYSATLTIMNGFVFLLIAALTTVSCCLLGVVVRLRRNCPSDTRDDNES